MLLGLVREEQGVAAQVLVSLGVDLSRVRQQVIQILSGYQPAEYSGSLPNQSLTDLRSSRATAPRCGVCRASLTESLAYRIVDVPADTSLTAVAAENADIDDPAVQVALVYCTSSGAAICGMERGSRKPPLGPPSPA